MGDILLYIVTHEVGHSLGLPHNFKASATYPIEKIRDKDWVKKNSHVPTLMDYARFNYVAQPEDGIDPEGPDPQDRSLRHVLRSSGATRPSRRPRRPTRRSRSSTNGASRRRRRPGCASAPPARAAPIPAKRPRPWATSTPSRPRRLGIKNLKRVMDMLPGAVLKPGEDYEQLDHMYDGGLEPARPRTGPRGQHHRRLRQRAQSRPRARRALHPPLQSPPAGGRRIPEREHLQDAGLALPRPRSCARSSRRAARPACSTLQQGDP